MFTAVTVDHAGARHRREQRDVQPRQCRSAASARIRRARTADADLRGVSRVGLFQGRGVAAGLRRPHDACSGRSRASAPIARRSTNCPARASRNRSPAFACRPRCFRFWACPPRIGRTFLESEDQPGQDVAVLSYGLWQRRYGGDPNAVGRTMTLDRRPYTIVGIMPASFQFPKRGPQINGEPAQVWTPLALSSFERSQQARGMMYNHTVIGRLRAGVATEHAARGNRRARADAWSGTTRPSSRGRSTRSWSPPCRSSARSPGRSSDHC